MSRGLVSVEQILMIYIMLKYMGLLVPPDQAMNMANHCFMKKKRVISLDVGTCAGPRFRTLLQLTCVWDNPWEALQRKLCTSGSRYLYILPLHYYCVSTSHC